MADADRWVCCGEIVPEGRMVCPQCEDHEKIKCSRCGNHSEFYTKGSFTQYYNSTGEPTGYIIDEENSELYCSRCNKKIRKDAEERKYDSL